VRFDVSVVKARAGSGNLSSLYLPINSAARCCASAALQPFPAINTFDQALKQLMSI